jgi:inner membrane protein
MPDASTAVWFDIWAWLFFIGFGLLLIILELFMGIDTGLDMVFIGSAFVIGGLITLVMKSWVWTAVVSGVICVLYVVIGRRYIHHRITLKGEKSNIDTIIGKTGTVEQDIPPDKEGMVKVGYEHWRARSAEKLDKGREVTVMDVSGVTLIVKQKEGGNQ